MDTIHLGRFDADGYLHLTGRIKEIYKLENGKYVSPGPLEEELKLSTYINQALVFGIRFYPSRYINTSRYHLFLTNDYRSKFAPTGQHISVSLSSRVR